MAGFEIVVTPEAALQQLGESGHRAVARAMELLSTEVWGNVGREAPRDEGHLAGSWTLRAISDLEYDVSTKIKYASFVHDGTGIYGPAGHRIGPVRASALAFQWMGQLMFRRSVAGQKPNPFAERAITKAGRRAQDFADIAVREVFG